MRRTSFVALVLGVVTLSAVNASAQSMPNINAPIQAARGQANKTSAQIRAAEAFLANGKAQQAASLLERAMLKLGRNPAAEAVVARAYRKLGREDLARRWDPPGR